jgi:hypothetical protein
MSGSQEAVRTRFYTWHALLQQNLTVGLVRHFIILPTPPTSRDSVQCSSRSALDINRKPIWSSLNIQYCRVKEAGQYIAIAQTTTLRRELALYSERRPDCPDPLLAMGVISVPAISSQEIHELQVCLSGRVSESCASAAVLKLITPFCRRQSVPVKEA